MLFCDDCLSLQPVKNITKVKNEILKTAGELFFKYGVRSVSIDDICSEMHISKKTFYVYFKQKDELVDYLLSSLRKQESDKQAELLNSDNIIVSCLENYNNFLKNSNVEKHLAFFYDLGKYYPKLMESHCKEKNLNLTNYIKSIIRLGVNQGFFRTDINVDLTASFIVKSFIPFVSDEELGKIPYRKKISFLLEVFFRLVSTQKGLDCYYENLK